MKKLLRQPMAYKLLTLTGLALAIGAFPKPVPAALSACQQGCRVGYTLCLQMSPGNVQRCQNQYSSCMQNCPFSW